MAVVLTIHSAMTASKIRSNFDTASPTMYPREFRDGVEQVLASAKHRQATRRTTSSGRFYDIDGESYPSVTTILGCIGKPALINWAANQERALITDAAADLYIDLCKAKPMSRSAYVTTLQARLGQQKAHKRELEKAAEIGTQAHGLIEWNMRRALDQKVGPEPRVVDDAQWAFMAFQDWAASVQLKPRFIEQTVFSRTHQYAGTMDLLAEVNSVLTLVDFKTSRGIYPESFLQNVAYQVALVEMGHATPSAGLIVRLPKHQSDPAFEVAPVPPASELFPVFLAVKQLWQWSYANELAYQAKRKAEAEVA
jgi:hypothetical protein